MIGTARHDRKKVRKLSKKGANLPPKMRPFRINVKVWRSTWGGSSFSAQACISGGPRVRPKLGPRNRDRCAIGHGPGPTQALRSAMHELMHRIGK